MPHIKHFINSTYLSNMAYDRDGYEKTVYVGQLNIKDDIWSSDIARDMENKN
jgi:hypothetical protein